MQEFLQYKRHELVPNYYEKQKRRAEIYILPALGAKNIDDITKRDIVDTIKSVRHIKTPTTKNTDKGDVARRVFNLIKQIYQYALHNDYTELDTPARIDINNVLPKHKATHLKAATSQDRVREIYAAIKWYRGYHIIGNALRFLALTALRPGNIRNLKWEYVDFENRVIIFPAHAMKMDRAFRLPLTDTLELILREVEDTMQVSEYIFPSPIRRANPMSDNTLNQAHKRMGAADQNAHGWRSSFSTICYEKQREHGYSAEVIESQLAHTIGNAVTRAYMRSDFLEERRELLQLWKRFLES